MTVSYLVVNNYTLYNYKDRKKKRSFLKATLRIQQPFAIRNFEWTKKANDLSCLCFRMIS